MPKRPTPLIPPARLPKVLFVTEAQLAHLDRVTPETLRSWRRRGEMPPIAVGPDVDEFVAGLRRRGPTAVCYRISDVSAWLWGNGGPGGRPEELPARAFDAENDRTMQLRRVGQAAKNAGDAATEKKIRRKLTDVARFAARLGFDSPAAYEDWIARGAPEDELPPEVRAAREAALDPDAPLADDESSERLQLQSDAAIAKMRGVSPRVVTAERVQANHKAQLENDKPLAIEQPQAVVPRVEAPPNIEKATSAPLSPWATLDDDPLFDPFATGRSPRRSPGGYFRGG